jgi:hypothetical protein
MRRLRFGSTICAPAPQNREARPAPDRAKRSLAPSQKMPIYLQKHSKALKNLHAGPDINNVKQVARRSA